MDWYWVKKYRSKTKFFFLCLSHHHCRLRKGRWASLQTNIYNVMHISSYSSNWWLKICQNIWVYLLQFSNLIISARKKAKFVESKVYSKYWVKNKEINRKLNDGLYHANLPICVYINRLYIFGSDIRWRRYFEFWLDLTSVMQYKNELVILFSLYK